MKIQLDPDILSAKEKKTKMILVVSCLKSLTLKSVLKLSNRSNFSVQRMPRGIRVQSGQGRPVDKLGRPGSGAHKKLSIFRVPIMCIYVYNK